MTEALYILGDLFEYWVGDDDDLPSHLKRVITSLKQASEKFPIYFLHGNRDFLIGDTFCQQTGCQLLQQPIVIDLYNRKTLLLHGDSLCTEDQPHQAFRNMVLNPLWQQAFLAKSLAERHAMAQQARQQSQSHTQTLTETIMDVNPTAVINSMQEYQVDQIIHGHTHRPAIHSIDLENTLGRRIVLGDWQETATILKYTPDKAELITI